MSKLLILPFLVPILIVLFRWGLMLLVTSPFGILAVFCISSTAFHPTWAGMLACYLTVGVSSFALRCAKPGVTVRSLKGLEQLLIKKEGYEFVPQEVPSNWTLPHPWDDPQPTPVKLYYMRHPEGRIVYTAFMDHLFPTIIISRPISGLAGAGRFAALHELGHLSQGGVEAYLNTYFELWALALFALVATLSIPGGFICYALLVIFSLWTINRWMVDRQFVEPEIAADRFALKRLHPSEFRGAVSSLRSLFRCQIENAGADRKGTPRNKGWQPLQLDQIRRIRVPHKRWCNLMTFYASLKKRGQMPPLDEYAATNVRPVEPLFWLAFVVIASLQAVILWKVTACIALAMAAMAWKKVSEEDRMDELRKRVIPCFKSFIVVNAPPAEGSNAAVYSVEGA